MTTVSDFQRGLDAIDGEEISRGVRYYADETTRYYRVSRAAVEDLGRRIQEADAAIRQAAKLQPVDASDGAFRDTQDALTEAHADRQNVYSSWCADTTAHEYSVVQTARIRR